MNAFAKASVVLMLLVLFGSGCSAIQANPVLEGAAVGAGAGAVGGAVAGNPGKGAAIGAAAGATAGLLSDLFGGWHLSTRPCRRWAVGSQQYDACMQEYAKASTEEARRQGACAGGNRSACYRSYGYGGGTVVPIDRPMAVPWPVQ